MSSTIAGQQLDHQHVVVAAEMYTPSTSLVVEIVHAQPSKDDTASRPKTCRPLFWALCLVGGAALLTVSLTKLMGRERGSKSEANLPTPPPTSPSCPNKRLRITHICSLPDLDEDSFFGGSDSTMDLKVLVDGEQYWPQDTRADCPSGESYKGSCVISDALLLGLCYPLTNVIGVDFKTGEDDSSSSESKTPANLKITIYDEDIGEDEFVDIFVPIDDWYFPSQCNDNLQLDLYASNSDTHIRVVVDTILPGDEKICGADTDMLQTGLFEVEGAFGDLQEALRQYVTLHPNERSLRNTDMNHRELIFPALAAGARFLVSGVSRLAGSFARGARSNPLSVLADFASIGTSIFSFASPPSTPQQQLPVDHWDETEAYFQQVLTQLDEIDVQLDSIQDQIQNGFETMNLVVSQAFAQEEIDEWRTEIATLYQDYQAYVNLEHTSETRSNYRGIFMQSCQADHSPYISFQGLYSHACSECDKMDGASQQYLLDDFVNLARSNFENVEDRILWFRRSFGTLLIGSLAQTLYLHSVCLYSDGCQNDDPVWRGRLEEMGEGLEEVARSLADAESRLE